jgi:enamine deaminase RidA (YjgF/YER057c/UK114 family)
MLSIEPRTDMFEQQFSRIKEAENMLMQLPEVSGAKAVFKRYFLSDATNQVPAIQENDHCTISYIQQPPLDGSKLAVWLYLQKGTDISNSGNSTIVSHNGYRHIWTMGLYNTTADTSYMQTWETLFTYIDILRQHDATLEANCVRTWFFVRDVDTQYNGLVKSRRECFAEQGLTADTHYIASTGIGGTPADPKALVQLGAYAITGFSPEQQRYLYAPTHLNRTSDYGVTFERGTLIQYGDRNHVLISGTASIDNHGEVLHVGDIRKQTLRMWENVEKLLEEGGMTYDDVMQIVVYLRDGADYSVVSRMFSERFPHIPYVITLAPVCRPTWLVEMECIAVKATSNDFPDF